MVPSAGIQKGFTEVFLASLTSVVAAFCVYGILYAYGPLKKGLRPLHVSLPQQMIYKYFRKWRFIYDAPKLIQDGYDNAKGGAFVVASPDVEYTFVSSKKAIREIAAASDSVLSLQAAAKQMIQPQYSMHSFNWFDQRGVDGTPLATTLRHSLTNNLPSILPHSLKGDHAIFERMFNSSDKKPHVTEMVRQCIAYTNALTIFGEEMAEDENFLKMALDFTDKTVYTAELVRVLPNWLAPILGKFMAHTFNSHITIHETLTAVVRQRMVERELAKSGHEMPIHKDCITWVMDEVAIIQPDHPWTAERVVHELMAVWFGAMHTLMMSTNFAVQNLAKHPEYVEVLRDEFESSAYKTFEETGQGLPLLDSFLKESARVSPVDSLSTRRKALQPFQLSDGTFIEKGKWICTPMGPMMRDPQNYVKPLEFHGFRHVRPDILASLDKCQSFESPEPEKVLPLTDVTKWQTWGAGRMACPGRFYAVAVMKQIVGLIAVHYDCEIVGEEAACWKSWRSCHVPSDNAPIVLRPRITAA